MLTKSRGAIAACALAIAAVGGSVAVIRAASPGPTVAASAALPSPVGTATTATVPSSTGADSGLNGSGSADSGRSNTGSGGTGTAGGQGTSPAAVAAAALSRSAGQGQPGPLAAGSLPADGAVPGASPALRALAAARAATTALPHSPQLLAELAGTTPSASASATASASGTSGTGSGSPTPTAQATNTTAVGSPAAAPAGAAKAFAAGAATAGTPVPSARTAGATAPAAGTAAAADTTSVPGLDVAGYQHPRGDAISWSQVAAVGYKFAAVKGTEGDYYVNPWVTTDLAQAKAAGLDVSPYHFAIPNAGTGTQQAQYAVEYSGYATGGRMLPLTLDIEYDPYVSTDHTNECYGLTAGQMTTWVAEFVSQTRSLTGQYPIIYTTANWWNTCTGGSTAFGADPMWVAAYGVGAPPLPAGWPDWAFWQYTSSGTVPGVDSPGTTDLDIFSPSVVGLINPGAQASRLHAKVSVVVGSLGALAHEALTYSAAGLPAGLTIGANGVITGTVTSTVGTLLPKTYRVTLSAKSAMGARSTVAFSWQVSPACQHSLANGVCPAA